MQTPYVGHAKSGLNNHFWTVPDVVSCQLHVKSEGRPNLDMAKWGLKREGELILDGLYVEFY